jgi:tetratricopeptide (TPR) repeat protein
MKKIYNNIVLMFAVFTFITSSCTKEFLDQKPTGSFNEETYYKNVDELETGLVACYAALRYRGLGFDLVDWGIGDLNSDDADCGSLYTDQPDGYNLSYSRQNPSNSWVSGAWSTYFAIIARCNQVVDRSSGTLGDTLEIKKIVNQARFLRAMCFYQLVTEFGDVPLVNKFLYPAELNLKIAPADSVWKQIESDLKEATNLPAKSGWSEPGRATSGAAWSLLGKVYLTKKKYEQANHAFYQVVNSNQYSLVGDFGFIFRHDGENCDESIFEMQTKNHIENGSLNTWAAAFRLPRDDGQGWGFDCPTKDLLNEFEKGDPRIIYTFMFPGDVFPSDGTNTYTVENTSSPTGYNSRKAWLPMSERADLNMSDWAMNYRYMRYAEVLLLFAESLNEVNKPDSALILLNNVRARARNTPTADPQRISCIYDLSHSGPLLPDVTTIDQSQLRQAIWHEQRVELAIEGHRRNMLLRTGQFKVRMETAKAYAGVTVAPYEWLLPIPQQEIELSNNVLIQNPGY